MYFTNLEENIGTNKPQNATVKPRKTVGIAFKVTEKNCRNKDCLAGIVVSCCGTHLMVSTPAVFKLGSMSELYHA